MKKYIVKSIEQYQKHKQIILYLFFGICTTAINTICYGFMHELLCVDNIPSTILVCLVAVMFAFINKLYVFESKRTRTQNDNQLCGK